MCRELVTKTYNKANGYETDCEVIYGDTDSVMVHFKVPGVARAMELGREAAEFVSKTFIKPIKLEFEKVSCWQMSVLPVAVMLSSVFMAAMQYLVRTLQVPAFYSCVLYCTVLHQYSSVRYQS